MKLSSRHRKTLAKVFEKPTRADVPFSDIERLFEALGGEVEERAGSRIVVRLGGRRAVFHRPHPQKETNKPTLRDVAEFLKRVGIEEER